MQAANGLLLNVNSYSISTKSLTSINPAYQAQCRYGAITGSNGLLSILNR